MDVPGVLRWITALTRFDPEKAEGRCGAGAGAHWTKGLAQLGVSAAPDGLEHGHVQELRDAAAAKPTAASGTASAPAATCVTAKITEWRERARAACRAPSGRGDQRISLHRYLTRAKVGKGDSVCWRKRSWVVCVLGGGWVGGFRRIKFALHGVVCFRGAFACPWRGRGGGGAEGWVEKGEGGRGGCLAALKQVLQRDGLEVHVDAQGHHHHLRPARLHRAMRAGCAVPPRRARKKGSTGASRRRTSLVRRMLPVGRAYPVRS